MQTFNTQFSSSNARTVSRTAVIVNTVSADISLSHAAANLLIAGAGMTDQPPFSIPVASMFNVLRNLLKQTTLQVENENIVLPATTETEMKIMCHFIECYLMWQEHERVKETDIMVAAESPSSLFNPDTYILGKLLLIDIRNWITGTWIEAEPERQAAL